MDCTHTQHRFTLPTQHGKYSKFTHSSWWGGPIWPANKHENLHLTVNEIREYELRKSWGKWLWAQFGFIFVNHLALIACFLSNEKWVRIETCVDSTHLTYLVSHKFSFKAQTINNFTKSLSSREFEQVWIGHVFKVRYLAWSATKQRKTHYKSNDVWEPINLGVKKWELKPLTFL